MSRKDIIIEIMFYENLIINHGLLLKHTKYKDEKKKYKKLINESESKIILLKAELKELEDFTTDKSNLKVE